MPWFANLFGRRPGKRVTAASRQAQRQPTACPAVETLERRDVPSTFLQIVTTPNYPTQGSFDALSVTVNNQQYQYAGIQFGVKLAGSASGLPGNSAPAFYSFCVDITHDANLASPYQVAPTPASSILPNSAAISFLYNTFNTPVGSPLDKTHAAGLQLAIWEEEYGTNIVTSSDVSFMNSYNGTAETTSILNAAAGYLGAVPSNPPADAAVYVAPGIQSMIGPALVSITGSDYLAANTTTPGSLTPATSGVPIAGTTVALTGTDEFGSSVSETTTTNAGGQYSFIGLNPSNGSGYAVTETPPASDIHLGQTSTTAGAVTNTPPGTLSVVSQLVLTTTGASSTDNFFELPQTPAVTTNAATTGRIDPEITTNAMPTGGMVGITTLNDSAMLSGGDDPTGTITFTLTAPDGSTAASETVNVNGDGTYSTPTGVPATQIGTYYWVASYSGDSINAGGSSGANAEPVVIGAASPAITTNATPTGGTVGNTTLNDSAMLTGGDSPTGTITFTLTAPDGSTAASETVSVNGDSTYSTPTGVLASQVGTYYWVASYSGDSNNLGVASGAKAEPVVIGTASPAITTNAIPTGGAVGSAMLTDSAMLSGGDDPTGTITFTLTAPNGSTAATETVSVNGDNTYSTPTPVLATQVGTYYWVASYSGDSKNMGAASGATAEPVVIGQSIPEIATNAMPTSGIVGATTLSDSAMLSGGDDPTGTITFTLTAPNGGTAATETVSVNGDNTYSTPTGVLASQVGTYYWVAAYSGDTNNTGVVSGAKAEPVEIGASSPEIATNATPTSGTVGATTLNDSATLSGGDDPTGTITFTLTAPNGSTAATATVSVNGDNTYSTPTGVLASQVGTYYWVAAYSGDTNNMGVASGARAEPVVIGQSSPAITTTATPTSGTVGATTLNDSAILSGGDGPTGTITFTLTAPNGSTAATETVSVNGDSTYSTPTGVLATQVGTYYWVAAYSGDTNNMGVASGAKAEPVVIGTSTPAITTNATPTSGTVGATTLNDSAILSGGDGPTGTITFTLTAPNGSTAATETVNVNGDNTYSTPTGVLATQVGTYYWVAAYSGDTNNMGVASGAKAEPVVIGTSTPAITTNAMPTSGTVGATTLNDSAILSGGDGPTGTITFTLTAPNGSTAATETVSVNGDSTYSTPTGVLATQVGTYYWVAAYSGDTNNMGVASGAKAEPVVIGTSTPAITTNATPTSGTVGATTLNDSAILSGGDGPTGTITFTLTAPNGSTAATETVNVNGDNTYSTPTGVLATQVGTYYWVAAYSGDTDNIGVASGATAEPVVIGTSTPAITTNAMPTSGTVGATTLNDSAILSGGDGPTGTITFTLTAPNGSTAATETVSVNGDNTYSTPTGVLATQVGTYYWVAVYSGDTDNKGVASGAKAEPVVIGTSTPSIRTNAVPTSGTVGAATLNDSAILSGGDGPTGTITFTLTAPNGSTAATETVSVNGDNTYCTPTGVLATQVGTYYWVAAYSGDTNNMGVSSGAKAEPVLICQSTPAITTNATPTSGTVGAANLNDSAILSGGDDPTGKITFTLTAPNGSTAATETVSVNGDNTYCTPTGVLATQVGTYYWVAAYSGDTNNMGVASGAKAEPVVICQSTPAITTNATPTSGTVGAANLNDSAILTGGDDPTGKITFTLTAPNGSTAATETVSVNGDNTYCTPTGVLATQVGTYYWVAAYSGDTNNMGVSSGAKAEPVLICQSTPAITTNATPTSGTVGTANLNDSAILSGGDSPTGTITFTLTAPNGSTAATETVSVHGDNTYSTPTGVLATQVGAYYWVAAYSGDTNNMGVASGAKAEPVVIGTSTPSITTNAVPTSGTVGAATLNDSAILSGGDGPTGTITFTLTAPNGSTAATETVSVNGDNTYCTPTGVLATQVGTYYWVAAYSGGPNNTGVSSGAKAEPVVICQSTPAITTNATPTSGTVGAANLNDSAILSGGDDPTGKITFTLTAPNGSTAATETVSVNGDNTYCTPTGVLATQVGTYYWVAAYSGDTNNMGVASGAKAEPVVICQSTPTITTNATPTSGTVGAANLNDSAILTGGDDPTGKITFTLTAPNGSTAATETVSVNGDNTYCTPTGVLATQVGTYYWVAAYSGDTNNMGVASGAKAEPVLICQSTPAITTNATPTSGTVGAATLNDSAILSGGDDPTGKITFTLTAPNGSTAATEMVSVNGDNTYCTPTGVLATQVGTYYWVAAYSGDTNNMGVASGAKAEPVLICQSTPAITTNATPTSGTVGATTLNDSAILSGGDGPTGTITFTLTAPNGSTAATEKISVNGDSTYSTPTGVLATQVGTYYWVAAYSGDTNNMGVASGAKAEPVVICQSTPAITTNATPTSGTVGAATLNDSAILSGGDDPTGKITFTLTAPNGSTAATETVSVNGDNTYCTPTGVLATQVGTYYWVAAYSGDTDNTGVSSGAKAEPVVICQSTPAIATNATPTSGTEGSTTLHDSATLSGGDGPTGTVTFTLTAPNGSTADTQTVSVNGDGTYSTPTGVLATQVGTYYWVAAYSGDTDNTCVASGAKDEPVVIAPFCPPQISVTKTADASTIAAGQTAGYTVTITNTGTVTDTDVTLSDPLPAGAGNDINWQIDTSCCGLRQHGSGRLPDHRIGGESIPFPVVVLHHWAGRHPGPRSKHCRPHHGLDQRQRRRRQQHELRVECRWCCKLRCVVRRDGQQPTVHHERHHQWQYWRRRGTGAVQWPGDHRRQARFLRPGTPGQYHNTNQLECWAHFRQLQGFGGDDRHQRGQQPQQFARRAVGDQHQASTIPIRPSTRAAGSSRPATASRTGCSTSPCTARITGTA